MSKKWMSSNCLQSTPQGEINEEKGIIEGVSIVTVGEAEGHGVSLDSEFVHTVAEMGNAKKQGVKVRFGHPNMCSTALGTFLGRAKNFREGKTERDGKEEEAALADIFLSNEAKIAPQGDLYQYVMGMAQNEADMFGTSIVFTPGKTYVRDEDGEKDYDWYEVDPITGVQFAKTEYEDREVFVECEELHASDVVDDPAANDGLFSRFSGETMAGQMTEFLDLHPQVWDAVQSNPSILEVLGHYADKMDEFMERYRAYRKQAGGQNMTDERTDAESLEEAGATEPEASETQTEAIETAEPVTEEAETEEETVEETQPETQGEETETGEEADSGTETETETETEEAETSEEVEPLSREDFARIADEFGDTIAAKIMREGGDYNVALKLHCDSLTETNTKLQDKLTELEGAQGHGKPAKVIAKEKDTKRVFNTEKKGE